MQRMQHPNYYHALHQPPATPKKPKKNRIKPVLYLILFCLALACKPFLYRQGFGLVFDYEVAINRVQWAGQFAINWVAIGDNKPTVVYRGAGK